MILTDTTVVIAYERARSARLQQIIQANAAAVCGVTVAEMFAGVRSATDVARCVAAFAAFQRMGMSDALWEIAGRNQALLRSNGVTVQLTDTVIATVAITADVELWTCDAHFGHIQRVLSALKLFQEPP